MLVASLFFVVESALTLLPAYRIWNLRKDGVVLQLILLALSAIFWYGFDLPFGPPGAPMQLVAVALAWRQASMSGLPARRAGQRPERHPLEDRKRDHPAGRDHAGHGQSRAVVERADE